MIKCYTKRHFTYSQKYLEPLWPTAGETASSIN